MGLCPCMKNCCCHIENLALSYRLGKSWTSLISSTSPVFFKMRVILTSRKEISGTFAGSMASCFRYSDHLNSMHDQRLLCISTSKQHVEHPFNGRNTQQAFDRLNPEQFSNVLDMFNSCFIDFLWEQARFGNA